MPNATAQSAHFLDGNMLAAEASQHYYTRNLRRLEEQVPLSFCDANVVRLSLTSVLSDAVVDFELFGSDAQPHLWGPRPLVGSPAAGVVRIDCDARSLNQLSESYRGSHMHPLVSAFRPLRRHGEPAVFEDAVALLMLVDYPNFFHQMGSIVIAWAAMQQAGAYLDSATGNPPPREKVVLYMLGNSSVATTQPFWSPALSAQPPHWVLGDGPRNRSRFRRVLLVAPATESWWWTVWRADDSDRRATFRPFVFRALSALGVAPAADEVHSDLRHGGHSHAPDAPDAPDVAGQRLLTLLQRSQRSDRRLLNADELARALEASARARGLAVQIHDFGSLSLQAQARVVRRSEVFVGTHGAGLVWNLFLPEGALLVELLNRHNANRYYANHCAWTRRPFASWQNDDAEREERATDAQGKLLSEFNNHMRVDVDAVRMIVERVLDTKEMHRKSS